ncbi:protein-disulfide reductase DsbD [Aliidiomarina minuta]|uniref:Thiol:disulfide interchange protein DsbD n=1 Tax=Aliidiomarina minuta TaxID=880057 RepID=A0A432W422_9GAMM|nr:protein-disulfide reductase DsbD [Aliidiomarina minuta]RUO24100.1 protein-disulfide reductase DsbD [Aliidiomarina minuta]
MKYLRPLLLTWLFLFAAGSHAQNFNPGNVTSNSDFLPVDQAFQFDYEQQDDLLIIRWQIEEGYYLYQHRFFYEPEYKIAEVQPLPRADEYSDEFFGDVFIYRDSVEITIQLASVNQGDTLYIRYQGCADAGLCYAPTVKTVYLNQVGDGVSEREPGQLQDFSEAQSFDSGGLFSILQGDNLIWALALFFILGVGLAFTPCVFPMYPIVAAIIGGQKGKLTASRGFLLSFVYVQGMAVTYTALGILVALAGMQYQAYMQHPAILLTLAIIFVVLALGMFGLYTLQLPASVQNRINTLSQKQKGGAYPGVFAMGALSGVIASPCTTAPLSGALLFIAQSGDVFTGGIILYALSIGMGIPLMIIGASGGKLLPKAGPWMNSVKLIFGLLLLAVALFLLERLIPMYWAAALWIAFFLFSVILIIRSLWPHLRNPGRMLTAVILGALLTAGILWQKPYLDGSYANHLEFEPVTDLAEVQQVVAEATDNGQWVMLDLYADWCVACKELEIYTFSDPQVQQQLADMRLIQADVTRTNSINTELLSEYQVLGLPTILFFNPEGEEVSQQRVTGFMNAADFTEHLKKLSN